MASTYAVINPTTGVVVWPVAVIARVVPGGNVIADLWSSVSAYQDGRPPSAFAGYSANWYQPCDVEESAR